MIISICIYISPYIWMYILRIVLIFRIFSLFGVWFGYQNPGFRFRCLNTSLSSESVYSLAFSIGMLLWFETMMMAFSFDTLMVFLCFMGYLDLQVGKKSNSIYHLSQEMMMQNGLWDVITMVGSSTHSLGVEFDRAAALIFIVVILGIFIQIPCVLSPLRLRVCSCLIWLIRLRICCLYFLWDAHLRDGSSLQSSDNFALS